MKFRELCSGFPQNGEIGISALQGTRNSLYWMRALLIAGERITPSQPVTGQHRDGIANHDARMVEKPLILPSSLRTFVGGQISLTSKQDRVVRSIEAHHGASGRSEFVGNRRFQRMDGSGGISASEEARGNNGRRVQSSVEAFRQPRIRIFEVRTAKLVVSAGGGR
jgi:hypothetical protein